MRKGNKTKTPRKKYKKAKLTSYGYSNRTFGRQQDPEPRPETQPDHNDVPLMRPITLSEIDLRQIVASLTSTLSDSMPGRHSVTGQENFRAHPTQTTTLPPGGHSRFSRALKRTPHATAISHPRHHIASQRTFLFRHQSRLQGFQILAS